METAARRSAAPDLGMVWGEVFLVVQDGEEWRSSRVSLLIGAARRDVPSGGSGDVTAVLAQRGARRPVVEDDGSLQEAVVELRGR